MGLGQNKIKKMPFVVISSFTIHTVNTTVSELYTQTPYSKIHMCRNAAIPTQRVIAEINDVIRERHISDIDSRYTTLQRVIASLRSNSPGLVGLTDFQNIVNRVHVHGLIDGRGYVRQQNKMHTQICCASHPFVTLMKNLYLHVLYTCFLPILCDKKDLDIYYSLKKGKNEEN